jgi:hypothetical protein
LYRDFVLARHQRLIRQLKAAGAASIGLISGGNTQPIIDYLIQTGSSLVMADYGVDVAAYKAKAAAAGMILRGSIQASLLETGSEAEIIAQAREVLNAGAPGGRFVLVSVPTLSASCSSNSWPPPTAGTADIQRRTCSLGPVLPRGELSFFVWRVLAVAVYFLSSVVRGQDICAFIVN